MIRVFLPSQLDAYTGGVREVEFDLGAGAREECRLVEVIAELERRYRGLAFRIIDEQGNIRRHIAIFVGETLVRSTSAPVAANGRVQIVGALSGG